MTDFLDSRARDIFADALGRPGAEREAHVVRACAADAALREQVLELVRAHAEAEGRLVESPEQIGERRSDRIGPYTLVQPIGEGGFGTVWLAEQSAPIRRKVALKILKAGMDSRQVVGRFAAERHSLARMDHPNIATIFDGGATLVGRPYFVMELVDGVPITKYCDNAALSPRERIELFLPVCQAVHHAHQKGVIHRDLKPSNVLVTTKDGEPVAKIIDFGIAKAVTEERSPSDASTGLWQLLGTPEYMAPEQADPSELGVDTRADVYSLGVVLYELLTGCRPFEFETVAKSGQAAIVRTIQEVEPPAPSQRVTALGPTLRSVAERRRVRPERLSSLLRGELDWIVMKALEKERSRRYDSASELADDLRRHLRHAVVLAGPPDRAYRLRKYLRRHRAAVIAGSAVAVALVAGAVAAGLGYREASEQARRAGEEAETSRHVVTLLERMLESSNPYNDNPGYTMRQLLDDFAADLSASIADEPEVELSLRRIMGNSYLGLGLAAAAEPHFRRAAELARDRFGDASAAAADIDCRVARSLFMRGEYDEALALLERVAELIGGSDAASAELRAKSLSLAADVLRTRGRAGDLQRAEDSIARAIDLQRRVLPPDAEELTASLSVRSVILQLQRRCAEAMDVMEEVLARDIERHGSDSLVVANVKSNVATLCDAPDADLDRIEQLLREALDVSRRRLGSHVDVWRIANNLGTILKRRRDLSDALEQFEAARDGVLQVGGDPSLLQSVQQNLAMTLLQMGQFDRARAAQQEAIATAREVHGGDHPDLANALSCLGDVDRSAGDHPAASRSFTAAIDMYRRLGATTDPRFPLALTSAAESLFAQRLADDAEPLARESVERLRTFQELAPEHLVRALHLLGLSRLEQGTLDHAETPLHEALERGRAISSKRVPAIVASLGELAAARNDPETAEKLLRVAIEGWRTGDAMRVPVAHRGLENLGGVLAAQGRDGEAIEVLRELLQLRRENPDPGMLIRYTLHDLASALERTGGLDESIALRREFIALLETGALAPDPPETKAAQLAMLATTLSRTGAFEEAESLLRKNLDALRAIGQETSLSAAIELTGLAGVLAERGDLAEAVEVGQRALATFEAAGASEHPQFATCLSKLVDIHVERGEIAEGLSLQLRVVESKRRIFGDGHVDVASSLAQLATLQLDEAHYAEAESAARESLAIREAKLAGTWMHHSAQALLGRALAGQRRYEEAEPLLVEACEKMEPPPTATERLLRALDDLIALYEQQGEPERAAPWREQRAALAAPNAVPDH